MPIKRKQKSRSRKPGSKSCDGNDLPQITVSNLDPGQIETDSPGWCGNVTHTKQDPCVNLNCEAKGWENYSDEQLEDLLLKKIEMTYQEAYLKLLAYGYDKSVARKTLLAIGYTITIKTMDFLSNIIQNSLAYINAGFATDNGSYIKGQQLHGDFSQLARYSLSVMVHFLQQVRPKLFKGNAMWCLLASNLHLGLASTMKVPFVLSEGETKNNNSTHKPSGIYKLSVDQDFVNAGCFGFDSFGVREKNFDAMLKRDVGLPKTFNLTPSLKSQLKKNVLYIASACRASMKVSAEQSLALTNSMASSEQFDGENSKVLSHVLVGLDIDEKSASKSVDQKNEVILDLVRQIKEVEAHVKKRKEWANQKVLQAAKKLSYDLSELKLLRMKGEEKLQFREKPELQDETVKRLWEMENALRDASCQVDVATAAMKRQEKENLEIKSEVEAFKLSASESEKICAEVAKRERNILKRHLALEKHNKKVHAEIEEDKKRFLQLQQQLLELKNAQEETEAKWRQEVEAKEQAIVQVQEELKLKKEAEVRLKRTQEASLQRIELNCQRFKDDVQRLEQEISHLQISFDSSVLQHSPNNLLRGNSGPKLSHRDITAEAMCLDAKYLSDLSAGVVSHRNCLICMVNEASIVFLPCSHQVLCVNCNEDYYKNAEARCPCCHASILRRIRVYGTSS